jgi:4-diphosphocytidyl-2-C-methyl-D-erythritol kinase
VSTAFTYRSYAKINLYLDVLSKRRDGYHNIETIFQSVSLADEIMFTEQRYGVTLECTSPELDTGASNLAFRAAQLLQEAAGCSRGVHISLKKNIPIAAGLAGGSGDAATTLIALNNLWELELAPAQLRRLGLQLGSDVPYCTSGGTMAATRRGEDLAPLPFLHDTWFVLAHPPITVSTSRVYHSRKLQCSNAWTFAGRSRALRRSIRAIENRDLAAAIFNRMEEAVFSDHPQLAEIKNRLLEAGCLAAAMSGSGPTMFGVCRSRRHANRVAEHLGEVKTTVVTSVPTAFERIT